MSAAFSFAVGRAAQSGGSTEVWDTHERTRSTIQGGRIGAATDMAISAISAGRIGRATDQVAAALAAEITYSIFRKKEAVVSVW